MNTAKNILFGIGATMILGFALAMPYAIYIFARYGADDSRISWAPLGLGGELLGLWLVHNFHPGDAEDEDAEDEDAEDEDAEDEE